MINTFPGEGGFLAEKAEPLHRLKNELMKRLCSLDELTATRRGEQSLVAF